ncbi:lipopolysaccharide assembly protein LapA domain-containing protein [Pedobacter sandarakinus]|uniref:lipopolysaccharide assembly protein LapA domain-containing protein n=1 Tax=Pedobacter sandarakinus TaxID=353156 RepID=UPI002245ECA9|nr:lipopolysaccharide assembly protein LapA domain-containing protein [Pedobacter sandarakinus]MCX2574760.1 lipopolysaccharide assembly protein LapA domain-containing protein [Pedobacter sandarakinus]
MSGKTIFIIILTALLTVFLMVNTDPVDFNFLVTTVAVSKLLVIGICIIIGFIIGFIAGRPRKTVSSYDDEVAKGQANENKKDLSDEDRAYIS